MLAGRPIRSAITCARSSPRSGDERSTMRYCIGLLSGTRRLRYQAFDDAKGLALAPVAFPERRVAHRALGIDQERHRQPSGLPGRGGLLVGVEEHGQGELVLAHELADLRRALAVVHGEHLERLALQLLA